MNKIDLLNELREQPLNKPRSRNGDFRRKVVLGEFFIHCLKNDMFENKEKVLFDFYSHCTNEEREVLNFKIVDNKITFCDLTLDIDLDNIGVIE